MKSYSRLEIIFALLAIAGCAGYKMEPPTANHPANPEAVIAPKRPLPRHSHTRERIFPRRNLS